MRLSESDEEIALYEQRKYHFARTCWPKRHIVFDGETWAQIFERLYQEPLDEYAKRMGSAERDA